MLLVVASLAHANPNDVSTVTHDGTDYSRPNAAARQRAARLFFETHGDQYDFLVVFPTFAADFGTDTAGLHTSVSNTVSGINKPVGSSATDFGSAGRLKGYIDLDALMPGGRATSLSAALGVLAHEVAHQWSGQALVTLPGSPAASTLLLGRDNAHWSFFFDSDASVLYGSDWVRTGTDTWTSSGSRLRYSDLDLYLMGFLSPLEVGPMTVLSPLAPGPVASDLPPADGTVLAATAINFDISNVIAANGQRSPSSTASQREFRAAFIILHDANQPPSAQQLSLVDAARIEFANTFFFLTRGRAVMDTEVADVPAQASTPSIQRGVDVLVSQQNSDGSWGSADDKIRTTTASIAALSLFSSPAAAAAVARALTWLDQAATKSTDGAARRISSLASQRGATVDATTVSRFATRGVPAYGPASGFQPTVIDTTLAAMAFLDAGRPLVDVEPLRVWLLTQQNADGGWPFFPGGPSRIEPTAAVMRLLSRATSGSTQALQAALGFLRSRRTSSGSFRDDLDTASATSEAITCLAQLNQLTPTEAQTATAFLLGQQQGDGSWGAPFQTAEALRALRAALSVNLVVAAGDVSLSASVVSEGEPVVASVVVRNAGLATATSAVRAYDSFGAPLSALTPTPAVAGGTSTPVRLQLDTTGHVGSTQVFIVVDPDGTLDESQETDNRAALPLLIQTRPAGIDLIVAQGSLALSPGDLGGPATVTATFTVTNIGRTDSPSAEVRATAGNATAGTSVSLAAGQSQTLTLAVPVSPLSPVVTVAIDPANLIAEASDSNNSVSATLPVRNVTDLSVVAVSTTAITQGALASVQWTIRNEGTVAANAVVLLEILDASGTVIATVPSTAVPLDVDSSRSGVSTWRADVAGTLTARARVTALTDSNATNDSRDALLVVSPSPLANLIVTTPDVTFNPTPVLEGGAATLTALIRNRGGPATAFDVVVSSGTGPAATVLARQHLNSLAGGATVSVVAPIANAARNSTYVVNVDVDNTVNEFIEDDNSVAITPPVSSLPNLVVTEADLSVSPAFPRQGEPFVVTASVLNAGDQPANNVTFDLTIGGTTQSVTIATVAPHSRADATFTVADSTLSGAVSLLGAVNASRAVTEGRYDDNTASRSLAIQDGSVAVTNLFFSPNGDGVQDSTEVLLRQPNPSLVTIAVLDAQQHLVRTLSTSSGTATWDGRDESGLIALDGPYRLEARSAAGPLGAVSVVLDNNHSLVTDTVGSAFFRSQVGFGEPSADDEGLVFNDFQFDPVQGAWRPRISLRSLGTGEIRQLSPDAWTNEQVGSGLAVSPRGTEFANFVYAPAVGAWMLRTFDFSTQHERILVRASPNLNPVYSPDGTRLLFTSDDGISVIDLTTEQVRVVGAAVFPSEMRFSPDGTMVSYTAADWLGSGAVYVVPANGPGLARRIAFDLPSDGFSIERLGSPASPAYAWHANSRELIYATPGVPVRVSDPARCYEMAYGADPESNPLPECFLGRGEIRARDLTTNVERQLFVDPGYAFERFANRSIVASPRGESVVFPWRDQPRPYAIVAGDQQPSIALVDARHPAAFVLNGDERPLSWSASGTMLTTGSNILWTDGNLRARVVATRPAGGGRLRLGGTATDLNFERYELSVRPEGGAEIPLARSTQLTRDSSFLDWTPSAPGRYTIRLKLFDRAGNVRTASTEAGWSTAPAISNLVANPRLFSPNGDNRAEATLVSYFANAPVTTDFVVSSGTTAVRTFQRTHLTSGAFSLAWDGRDDLGQALPDGDYVVAVERLSTPVAIDTTPPSAQFNLSSTLPPRADPFTVAPRQVHLLNSPFDVLMPTVQLNTSWSATDAHFKQWVLEASDPNTTSFSAAQSGIDQAQQHNTFLLSWAAGRRLRLRASDGAENETLTPTLPVPERFFVTAIDDADHLYPGTLVIDGNLEPRIDKMSPHYDATFQREDQAELQPSRVAFAIDSSVGAPMVAYSIAYTADATGQTLIDANPALLSPHVLVWDARLVAPGDYTVEVRATDTNGRQFSDVVRFRRHQAGLSVCLDPRSMVLRLSSMTAPLAGTVELLSSSGALVSSTQYNNGAQVDVSSLTECNVRLRYVGFSFPGGQTNNFNLCGAGFLTQAASTSNFSAEVYETFVAPVSYAEVFVDGRPLGTTSRFGGVTSFNAASNLSCGAHAASVVAHFADGSTSNAAPGLPLCTPPRPLNVECTNSPDSVVVTSRTVSPQLRCLSSEPVIELNATARVSSPKTVATLELFTTDSSGLRNQLSAVAGSSSTLTTSAQLDTSLLPEGSYTPGALAFDSSGATLAAQAAPVLVDRTPPVAHFTHPLANQRVCPSMRRDAFGRLNAVLALEATAVDPNLSGTPTFSFDSTGAPTLSTARGTDLFGLDLPAPASGDYEVVLEARDLGGSATCEGVQFHFVAPARLTAFTAAPRFSPDGDGRFDTNDFTVSTTEAAEIEFFARASNGQEFDLGGVSAFGGATHFSWNGTSIAGPLADGDYDVLARLTDECGASDEATTAVRIDTTAPVARLNAPLAGDTVFGTVSPFGEASDQSFNDATLALQVSGAPSVLLASSREIRGAFGSFAVPTTPSPARLILTVTDSVGHTSSASVDFFLSAALLSGVTVQPPVVSPNGDGQLDDAELRFTLDADAAITVELVVSGATVGTPLLATVGAGAQSVPLPATWLSVAPDGVQQVRLTAVASSTSQVEAVPLTIDRNAPFVAIDQPISNSVVGEALSTALRVDDPTLAAWSLALTQNATTTQIESGSTRFDGRVSVPNLVSGAARLTVVATDLGGNETTLTRDFVVDSTPPVVALSAPSSGAVVRGVVAISATATDDFLSTARLTSAGATVFAGTAAPASISWDTSLLPDGPTELVLVATDLAGHQSEARVAVIIDNTPPLAHIDTPRASALAVPGSIVGSATDDHFAGFVVEMAPGAPDVAFQFTQLSASSAPVNAAVLAALATAPPSGTYTLRLTARDTAGNVTVDTTSFEADSTPPDSPALAVTRASGTAAVLNWTSTSTDVTSFVVHHVDPLGVATDVPATSGITLTGLADGPHTFTVIAVDHVGLRSVPSNQVTFVADGVGPLVSIASPLSGSTIGVSRLPVVGTVAASDLSEWKLLLGEGAVPTSFSELARSPAEARQATLATIDTATLVEGNPYTLALEATDVLGNVSRVTSTFTLDDLAPDAPVLLSATTTQRNVRVTWQAPTAPDAVGIVLFRNFQLVNGPASSVSDLRPYVLPLSQTEFIATGLPDGTHTFVAQAVDAAGNLSALSNSLTVTIDLRAPSATIVTPAALARVQGQVAIVADSLDEDIASMRIEARVGGGAWSTLANLSAAPWVASFDATNIANVIELRAVATDRAGATDLQPLATGIFGDPALSAPTLTSSVSGSAVSLAWTHANAAGRVSGFDLRREGGAMLSAPPVTATATATSGTAAAAYDGNFFTNWVSAASFPQTLELDFATPRMIRGFNGSSASRPTFDVDARVRGVWVRVLTNQKASFFNAQLGALEVEAIRVIISSDDFGLTFWGELGVDPLPIDSRTSFSTNEAPGQVHFTIDAFSPFGGSARAEQLVTVYQPTLTAAVSATAASEADLQVAGALAGDAVELLRASVVVAQSVADATGHASFRVPLNLGSNVFTARARFGTNVSLESSPVTVVRADAPTASVQLNLDGVSGSDVNLSFVVTGNASTITQFAVARSGNGNSSLVGMLGPSARSFIDPAVSNGSWDYTVTPLTAGVAGAASNIVTAVVNVFTAAPMLTAIADPAGSTAHLSWTSTAASYVVERSAALTGPFATIATASANTFDDSGLAEGSTWFYRVTARDNLGNRSAPSNVASVVIHDSIPPAPPRITAPTRPGTPLTVTQPMTSVSGFAEPGTWVELQQNSTSLGTRAAGALQSSNTLFATVSRCWALAAAERSRLVAYDTCSSVVVLQNVDTGASTQVDLVDGYPTQLEFSPDERRVAVEMQTWVGARRIVIIDVSSNTVSPATAEPGDEYSPRWVDQAHVAFVAARGSLPARVTLAVPSTSGEVSFDTDAQVTPQQMLGSAGSELFFTGPSPSSGFLAVWAVSQTTHTARLVYDDQFEPPDSYLSVRGSSRIVENTTYGNVYLVELTTGTRTAIGIGRAVTLSPSARIASIWRWGPMEVLNVETLSRVLYAPGTFDGYSDRFAALGDSGFAHSTWWGEMHLIEWGAPFRFDNVALVRGTNDFVAIARDDAGNPSRASAAIRVVFDASTSADLTPELALLPAAPIATQPASALVTVRNLGDATSAPTQLVGQLVTALGATRPFAPVAVPAIAAHSATTLTVRIDVSGLSGAGQELFVEVDPAGVANDADRTNNRASKVFSVAATAGLSMTLTATPGVSPANSPVVASVDLANAGATRTLDVHIFIASLDGTPTSSATVVSLGVFANGASTSVQRTLDTGTLLADDYLVVAEARDGTTMVARSTQPLTIAPQRSATITVTPSRATYLEGELVTASSLVTNTSVNADLTGAVVEFVLEDPTGVAVESRGVSLPSIARQGSVTVSAAFVTPPPVGASRVRAALMVGGTAIATASRLIDVVGRARLAGEINVVGGTTTPVLLKVGVPADAAVSVTNRGSAAADQVDARVSLVTASGSVVAAASLTAATIGAGTSVVGVAQLATSGLPPGLYLLTLTLSATGIPPFEAASIQVRLTDGEPPELQALSPADGSLVSAHPLLSVRALDLTGVREVRAQIDGASSALSAVSGTGFDGLWSLSMTLLDGPHTVIVSAADLDGNDGQYSPTATNPRVIHFTSDGTPPVISISGVADGQLLGAPVTPVITVTDASPTTVQLLVNGIATALQTPIATEGAIQLDVLATDAAGNQSTARLAFVLDLTPPAIAIGGFSDGAFTSQPVTPSWVVTDAHLTSVTTLLDGQPIAAGSIVSSEGPHQLLVFTADALGHTAQASASFTIDRTAPGISFSGVANGALVNHAVSPFATVADANLLSLNITLDGAAFQNGATVAREGAHVVAATAIDRAGNVGTAQLAFTIDTTAPLISISGVFEGQVASGPVIPVFSATDASTVSVAATLDGVTFISGTQVSSSGPHTLTVSATDAAGNAATSTVHFRIEPQVPLTVSLGGFVEGSVVRGPVTPTVTTTGTVQTLTVTLDGLPFGSGTSVSTEGDHTLSAVATNATGIASATGHFTIDVTAPTISITGVVDGQTSNTTLTPTWAVNDLHLVSSSATLNGAAFLSGTAVSAPGTYVLVVSGLDAASNAASTTVHFTITSTQPVTLTRRPLKDFNRTLAYVEAPGCGSAARATQTMSTFLTSTLGSPRGDLHVVGSKTAFLSGIRSGLYNTYVIAAQSCGSTKSGDCDERRGRDDGHEGDEHDDDWNDDDQSDDIKRQVATELSEQIFGGHAGLIVIANVRPTIDVTVIAGLNFGANTNATQIGFVASPVSSALSLTATTPGLTLLLSGASAIATWSSGAQAAALANPGLGHVVTFGLDLSRATPTNLTTNVLQGAALAVLPARQVPLQALSVDGEELELSNPGVSVTLTESLTAPLVGVGALPQAVLTNFGRRLSWQAPAQSTARSFRYWARLPDSTGTWTVTSEAAYPGGPLTQSGSLSVGLSGAALLANAQSAAQALPTTTASQRARRQTILNALTSVQSRRVAHRPDAERNIDDLLQAADAARLLGAGAAQARQQLDHLITYWEARWYTW